MNMKITVVIVTVIILLCATAFAAESLQPCNEKFKSTMTYCFQNGLPTFMDFGNLNELRDTCMNDATCKTFAKKCLISNFESEEFSNCPLVQTYIKSINRMFR
ncbi:hypothetical protein KSF78_0001370 [Schistosoma japonicum]|uniref:Egg protein CP422 n=1 Tax=Schistosoma japonicum TaxID=6182 RepID=C1LFV5_SCHJA|nr:hypothetical protein KSF78_0001370 [Schistosoma japonicum]CAX73583.1 hypothetical protein [Schistosoma japonicum]